MEAKILDPSQESIEAWCFIEIFGHQQMVGRLSERKFGSEIMFQVDVPLGEAGFGYSRLISPQAIFSITPTTEEWCRKYQRSAEKNAYPILPFVPAPRPLRHGYQLEEGDAGDPE